MSRNIDECNAILRNLSQELRSRCPTDDQYCCYLHCCFVNRQHKEVWETWYFWFGVVLIVLLMVTSAASFLMGMCSRKRHQLIRVHHQAGVEGAASDGVLGMTLSSVGACAAPVNAVTGPDGLIHPFVAGTSLGGLPAEVAARYKAQGAPTATAIFRGGSGDSSLGCRSGRGEGEGVGDDDDAVEDVAGPLEPAYPPMQPVTIVRGPLPEGGYRRTESYTELVLPPGYVDPHPSHKRHP